MSSKYSIQIFNDSLAKEITSSSEDPASCFVVRARRKLRTKLKRKSRSSPRKYDSSSSTSIADTESWPTEEVDEEEVIHIEVDDDSKELLVKDTTAKGRKRGRVRRIVAALTKIPWLGKGTVLRWHIHFIFNQLFPPWSFTVHFYSISRRTAGTATRNGEQGDRLS